MAVHIAYLGMVPVDAVGNVLNKSTASIGQMCSSSSQMRVLPDSTLPNTATSPTIAQYLTLEAAGGFVLNHLDQTMIITYG